MKRLGLSCLALPLFAQTLQLPHEAAVVSGGTALNLTFSGAQAKLTAMQWEIVVPAEQMTLETYTPGAASRSAEKLLQCAGSWRVASKIYVHRCILAGGVKPIPDGTVAELKFKMRGKKRGPAIIRVERTKGVTADLKAADLASSECRIAIR
jgi:hypothetical protein